jgi:hypothetical protein
MLNEEILAFPNDQQSEQTAEPPFARYIRSTLAAALRADNQSYLSLASNGGYDILKLPQHLIEAYQWRSIYCRPTKELVGGKKTYQRGLLCIGEATGAELRDAMLSAGFGTRFTVIGGSEYRMLAGYNRRGQIFDPRTTSMACQMCIGWSSAMPDWQRFGEAMESLRVLAAMRIPAC